MTLKGDFREGWTRLFHAHTAQRVINAFSGKWPLVVLSELSDGPRCHNELARACGLDHKTLGRELKRLEHSRLIRRDILTDKPVRVCYQLTARALSAAPLISELAECWLTPEAYDGAEWQAELMFESSDPVTHVD
ncbi:winged helix-turn-helix transcriptional regulator [Nonomuraea sp. CA-141351]|uniref:winged helix-turn-helix transcriptional regulator n=1 Tax=Nonomuraea sp. CA-141351 TaxID=3239996 RepID=UPI003D92846A